MGSEESRSEDHFKIGVQYVWRNNFRLYVKYSLRLVLLFLCEMLLTVDGIVCIVLLSSVYCCTVCALLSYILLLPDCWLEVSIRKVLRPATSAQVLLGFPVSVYKRTLGWFPVLQVATACFSCSPPRSNQNPPNLCLLCLICM